MEIKPLKETSLIQDPLLRERFLRHVKFVNKILNHAAKLGLALEGLPLKQVDRREKKFITSQLEWIQGKIEEYLNEQ